ncbi:L-lactate dehydrogenase [Candidatus Woesearchaeota archaeon]|nr:L-lactate dehydrogenase [Candidatus Woesearchaeota archaeon]
MEKVAIVGAGFVGSTAAYALMIQGIAAEIALIDIHKEKAEGEALDLEHGMQFTPESQIYFGDSYDLCANADIVVVTAGVGQKPGETRLELIEKNANIFKDIIPKIAKAAPNTVMLIITNPVDVLTYLAIKYSGFPASRVFGSGTTLDTARFRHYIGDEFGVSPKSVHGYILGEHGDSEFPAFSLTTIGGIHIEHCEGYAPGKLDECFKKTKNAAYEVINRKGATYYAIGLVISKLCRAVLNNEQRVYPVSNLIHNYYDEGDLCLSVPCVVGKGGIQRRFQPPLNEEEQEKLHVSAQILREALAPYR